MQAFRKISVLVLAFSIMLVACAPQQAATQNPADLQAQVSTSVAMTISAQNAETAAAQPQGTATSAPTEAPVPTLTALPTVTPFVAPTPVISGSGGGSGGGNVAADYACNVVTRPWDNTKFAPGDDFDVDWTIINTGTKTWIYGLDLNYFSGPNFTVPTKTFVQLPELKPGQSFHVVFDAKAPTEKGFHVMTWKLEGVYGCYPYVAIIVK
jgi:hypothetical protein